jgi:TonB-dependent receptor-like protein
MHRFHRRVAFGLALGLLALAARSVAGQDDSVVPESELILPTLNVTAPRGPSDPVPAASSVTMVERATLESSEERNLNGVLRGLPGVTLHRAGSGTTLSSVSVRGVQSGQGQFTLDGIPLYSGVSGAFNLSAWPAVAWAFERVLGKTAQPQGQDAFSNIERALRLYRGPFLRPIDPPWVVAPASGCEPGICNICSPSAARTRPKAAGSRPFRGTGTGSRPMSWSRRSTSASSAATSTWAARPKRARPVSAAGASWPPHSGPRHRPRPRP